MKFKLFSIVLVILLISACSTGPVNQGSVSEPSMTSLPENKEEPTSTIKPSDTPADTATATLTDTPEPTASSTPTDTPVPTETNTPEPSDTPEPTKPVEPTIGPIMFFIEGSEEPGTEFRLGTVEVYTCFQYWNMNPDMRISGYVYHNGEEWANVSQMFNLQGDDSFCFILGYAAGSRTVKLDAGNWEIKIYIDNELAQSGKFKILR